MRPAYPCRTTVAQAERSGFFKVMGPSPLHGAWAALDPDAVVGSIATPKTRILKDARGVGDDVVALGTDRCVIDGLASRHWHYTKAKKATNHCVVGT